MRWVASALLYLAPLHAATYYVNFQVRDSTGLYLPKVDLEEIKIFVDGAEQKPEHIFGLDLPAAVAVFYDVGPQMAPEDVILNPLYRTPLQRSQAVTMEILDRLKTDYSMTLYSYYDEPVRLIDFTGDTAFLENALRKLQPGKRGEITQRDARASVALDRGIEVLKNRDEKRKILVLFTYVMDMATSQALESIARRLERHNIQLYVISFGPRSATGPGFTPQERLNSYWFRKLTDSPGGAFYLTDL